MGEPTLYEPPPTISPSGWSGWPDEWSTPNWGGRVAALTGTAWGCIDLNSSVIAEMEPYIVGNQAVDQGWLANPDPDIYSDWTEFAKQLLWDYHLGECFVVATAFFSTGWPARFRVLPPWMVQVDMDRGFRRYRVGSVELAPNEILHLRYQSTVDDARGHGPLEAGRARVIAASVLMRYATNLAAGGGIPPSTLTHDDELSDEQTNKLKQQWVAARLSSIGEPAVLSGGVKWEATQVNPKDMALVELSQFNESRIAVLLGVPPFLMGLPSGGDSMTYANITALFDYHWRAGLRPKVKPVMRGLSQWALPRGTQVEVNEDDYVQAGPKERAETAAIYNGIQDAQGNPVLTVEQIQESEHVPIPSAGPLG